MTNGLTSDSSTQPNTVNTTAGGDCPSAKLQDISRVVAAASSQYAQLYSMVHGHNTHSIDGLVQRIMGRSLDFGSSSDNHKSSLVCTSEPSGQDHAEAASAKCELLSSPKPSTKPQQFLSPYFAFLSSSVRPSTYFSVQALTSASGNAQDEPAPTPASEREDAPGLTSFHHVDSLPVNPLQRKNMPLYTPMVREGEFICGWGAAFINICVTFPINKAIFRQQLHGISGRRAIRQLRKDGIHYLYRGLLPPLLQKTMSSSVMFGMYFHCQDVLKEHFPKMGTLPNHAIAAMVSGTLEATFMPFERIQTLMQNREFHSRFSNTPDAFRHLWSYGLKEYYRGLSLIIWRNGPSNVAFFLGREYLQTLGPQSGSPTNKMLRDFISGACLGAMISTVFFPLNVVKTRMQSTLGGPHDSGWATLQVLLAERKGRYGELFKGVHLNYTRSFISWGIINASFEVLIKLYNGDGRARGS